MDENKKPRSRVKKVVNEGQGILSVSSAPLRDKAAPSASSGRPRARAVPSASSGPPRDRAAPSASSGLPRDRAAPSASSGLPRARAAWAFPSAWAAPLPEPAVPRPARRIPPGPVRRNSTAARPDRTGRERSVPPVRRYHDDPDDRHDVHRDHHDHTDLRQRTGHQQPAERLHGLQRIFRL